MDRIEAQIHSTRGKINTTSGGTNTLNTPLKLKYQHKGTPSLPTNTPYIPVKTAIKSGQKQAQHQTPATNKT
jgi:hypothetical protein